MGLTIGDRAASDSATIQLTVNGQLHEVVLTAGESLLDVLRERLGLTGTKLACARGECGACTVLLDGRGDEREPAYSCITLAAACEGRRITTVEGLADGHTLHPVQSAFVRHDALQCGYCTPGQILAAVALLDVQPRPSEEDVRRWMSGNLCRCGAQPKIVAAVLDAAERMHRTADG